MQDFGKIVPDGTLADKVILITGASQGIGAAAAFGMARAGATVILGARRGDVVEGHASRIVAEGGRAIGLTLDVTKEEDVKRAVDTAVAKFGRLDGAFNNAGIDPTTFAGLADQELEEWRAIHAVKVEGTFLCMKHEILAMVAGGGGAIVNNGSVVGSRPRSHVPAASSSQSAITGMTKAAAVAYGHEGVRVNMVQTGLIITPERAAKALLPGQKERLNSYAPMGRPGHDYEIGQVAAWLLSDYARYVNGVVLPVDGGALAGTR